ncbi:MAG: DUF2784 domain-containing protein [Gammaproteobacteria bacterium]|jgi:hypothetical protein|nr:DUF2784 domain-containing protein [Gammaproteobacteria bacterium]
MFRIRSRHDQAPKDWDERMYTLAADLTLLIHVAYVVFVIGGQVLIFAGWALGWNWTRNRTFRWLHLAAIGLVAWEAWTGADCPLTLLENYWRRLAGLSDYPDSFIAHWTHRYLYYSIPEWVFILAYSLFALLILITFIAYPPRKPDCSLHHPADHTSRR